MFEARFQSFDDPQPAQTGPRLQALRAELTKRGLSGLILPRADRHQNEYVPPSEERLAWLTGFTGSAGNVIVLGDKAALFVDGRYTLAARTQVETSVFTIVPIADTRGASSGAKTVPVGMDATGAAGRKQVAPLGAVRDELDERSADPRMSRERASEARPLLSVCRMAFDQHRMKDAEGACTAARDANPESADAHALLAHSLYNRNKKREALASAERAVKLNPKLADAYVIIGGVRQEEGDVEEARRAYQRYLELEPKGSFAADLRAIIGRLPAKM